MMEYEEMTLEDLAHEMADIRKKLDTATDKKAGLQRAWDMIRKVAVPNKMEELGMESARIKGVGTVSLLTDAYCTTPAANADALKSWLTDNGYGSLIKPTVNASSLKSFMKEQILEGNKVPDMVNFAPYTYASITGAPKS